MDKGSVPDCRFSYRYFSYGYSPENRERPPGPEVRGPGDLWRDGARRIEQRTIWGVVRMAPRGERYQSGHKGRVRQDLAGARSASEA